MSVFLHAYTIQILHFYIDICNEKQNWQALTKNKERKVFTMANQIFMRVNEVAEELGISIPFAYRIIRQMNEELAKTGCITIAGRIDRKFFHEKFYGTRSETERKEK